MLLPWRDVPVGATSIRTSLTQAEGNALRDLADGRCVLEIGSAFGYSAVRMAATAESIIAVDPHADLDSLSVMRENLGRYDHNSVVSVLLAASEQVLPRLAALGTRFDLAFIDGDHTEASVERDVTLALPLLTDAGTLACHDYGEDTCPGVKGALDDLYPDGPDRLVDTLWIRQA